MPRSKSSDEQRNEVLVIRHMDNVHKATGRFMGYLLSISPDDMGAMGDAILRDITLAQRADPISLLQLQCMAGAFSKLLVNVPTLINKERNLLKRAINRRHYLSELKDGLINPLIIYLGHIVSSMESVREEDTVDRLNEYMQNINSFESLDRKETPSYTLAVVMLRHVMQVGTLLYSNATISTEIKYRLNVSSIIEALDSSTWKCCIYQNMNNPLQRSAFRFAFSTLDGSRSHLSARSSPAQRAKSPAAVTELSNLS
jgi:hypothetical protein